MPPAKKTGGPTIFIASETFACELDGENIIVHTGETRVREGHRLLDVYPGYFKPVDEDVHHDLEQATAKPGEQRGAENA